MNHAVKKQFCEMAGVRVDVAKILMEEKAVPVSVPMKDVFRYIDQAFYGNGGGLNYGLGCGAGGGGVDVSPLTALSCLDALEKAGYSKDALTKLRKYFDAMKEADGLRRPAQTAIEALYAERMEKEVG
jgi:hypothetical protein